MKSSDSRCRASIAVEHHEAKKLSNKDSFFCFCGEDGGLAYVADHLLTHEGNQKPASLCSGILRCTKKPSLLGLGFFISLSLLTGSWSSGGAGGIRTLVQTWDMLRFLHA